MPFIPPRYPESLQRYNRAVALFGTGDYQPALYQLEEILHLESQWLPAWNLKAVLLGWLNQCETAEKLYRKILQRTPDDQNTLANLGNLYYQMNRLAEAEAVLLPVVEPDTDHIGAGINLSQVYAAQHRLEAGIGLMERLLARHGESALLRFSYAQLMSQAARPQEAIPHYRRCLQLNPDHTLAASNLLANMPYLSDFDHQQFLDASCRYGAQLAARVVPRQQWSNRPDPERALRIGLVSPDFHDHPVAYFLAPVLASMEVGDVAFTAYSTADY